MARILEGCKDWDVYECEIKYWGVRYVPALRVDAEIFIQPTSHAWRVDVGTDWRRGKLSELNHYASRSGAARVGRQLFAAGRWKCQ